MWKYKGWNGKRRGRSGEKASIYAYWTLSAFWLSFFFEKRTPPPFPHISSGEACVHTWGLKRNRKGGEKAGFSFCSSFSPEKRMCASLYASNMATHMCRHGDGKKKRKDGEKEVIFLLFFSFPCKKICASLYTSNMATHMCIHGE